MINHQVAKFMNKISECLGIPLSDLQQTYVQLLLEIEETEKYKTELYKAEVEAAVTPFYRLKQNVMFQFGDSDLYYTKRNLVIFSFNGTLARPKENRAYPMDVNDWEWVNPQIKKLLLFYMRVPDHRLVVISNEIISWKVEMMMNLINEVLPEYGKATVLIGVTQRFPKTEHFYRHFPPGCWSDAMVVGSTPEDEQFAKELNVDFFTQEQLHYDI